MEREEKDTQLKKNTVFRRNKKCISQDYHHHCHHRHNCPPPNKIIKLESSTESETEIKTNNSYTLPVSNLFFGFQFNSKVYLLLHIL